MPFTAIARRQWPQRPARLAGLILAVAALLAGGTAGALAATANGASPARAAHSAQPASAASQYLFVHDPTMAEEGGTFYVFSTGDPPGVIGNGNIQIRTSRNLRDWTYAGTVFAGKPSWITDALGNIPNLWAPDISFY